MHDLANKFHLSQEVDMRIWSQQLLPVLCQQHILGQHRELAALRGDGWGKRHETVQYALNDDKAKLIAYHWLMMDHGEERFDINFADKWGDIDETDEHRKAYVHYLQAKNRDNIIYDMHDARFVANDIQDLTQRSINPEHGCECDVKALQEVADELGEMLENAEAIR